MRIIIAILVLCCPFSNAFAGENLVVPIDVYDLIKARGCEQVADFYQRPSVEEPPYALINRDWGKKQIAVWCTSDGAKPEGDRSYTLLLSIDDPSHPLAKCTNEIRGIRHIGGLRFVNVARPANEYHFIGTAKRIPLKGALPTKAVRSIYDGVGEYYVCVGGKWAVRAVH